MDMDFEIERIAALAKLHLNEQEKERLQEDLREIVTFAGKATAQIGSGAGEPIPISDGTAREDLVLPPLPQETLLRCAPASYDGCITLPVTVGEGDGV